MLDQYSPSKHNVSTPARRERSKITQCHILARKLLVLRDVIFAGIHEARLSRRLPVPERWSEQATTC